MKYLFLHLNFHNNYIKIFIIYNMLNKFKMTQSFIFYKNKINLYLHLRGKSNLQDNLTGECTAHLLFPWNGIKDYV